MINGSRENWLGRDGAELMCQFLTAWWSDRGYHNVRFYIQPVTIGVAGSYAIKSNMVNGWPPGGPHAEDAPCAR